MPSSATSTFKLSRLVRGVRRRKVRANQSIPILQGVEGCYKHHGKTFESAQGFYLPKTLVEGSCDKGQIRDASEPHEHKMPKCKAGDSTQTIRRSQIHAVRIQRPLQ